jgi:hypothetical protein
VSDLISGITDMIQRHQAEDDEHRDHQHTRRLAIEAEERED